MTDGLAKRSPTTRATAAEVCRNFGLWQDRAMLGPVLVTNHGRAKTVLLSIDAFEAGGAGASPTGDDAGALLPDRIDQAYLLFDARLCVAGANRAAEQHFGMPATALIGRAIADLFAGLAESVLERVLVRVMATGQARRIEAPAVVPGGRALNIHAYRAGDGVAMLLSEVGEDAETVARLAQADALDALFATHGAAGVARLSMRGTFVEVGGSLAAMIGFDAPAMLRARLIDIVPIGARVALGEALERVLGAGETVAVETVLMTRRGGEVAVTLVLAPTRADYAIDGAALLVTPRREPALPLRQASA